jgi:acetolactate synthase-1/2/3 large subunit
VFGTRLHNPDFAKYAEAFGGFGAKVTHTAEFEPALNAALAFARERRRPAVIELSVDPQHITPNLSLDSIREKSLNTKPR